MRIVGEPECPLCGGGVSLDEAFFPEYTDGLSVAPVRSMFRPPGLHWNCYLAWPGRPAFARQLFARLVADAGSLWGRAHVDERVAVLVFVAEPHNLRLVLAETGRWLSATLADWEQWRTVPEAGSPRCHPVEREALQQALAPVWQRFPIAAALLAGTDWIGSERHLYASSARARTSRFS
jgi:hypothetical protein